MYSVPRPVRVNHPQKSNHRRPFNALLPLCCLGFVAFLIAATIVIALIPLYLPTKTATLAAPTFLLAIDFNGTLGNDGYFDQAARDAFARAIEQGLHLKEGAMHVLTGTVATEVSKRKRRNDILSRYRRGFREFVGIQRIYLEYRFDPVICGPRCLSSSYIARLPVIKIVVVFIFNGIRWTLVLTIDFSSNTRYTIPPTNNPSSTTVTTKTTTRSTATTTSISPTPNVPG